MGESVGIVLVVEDEGAIQVMAEEALTDAGFEPAVTASGEEALTLLMGPMRDGYRALVTDIRLRGTIDGWEIGRRVREIDPEFPVVYISGVSAAEWPSKGVPNSIMLEKPFAPAQLVTAVAQLVNKSTPIQ